MVQNQKRQQEGIMGKINEDQLDLFPTVIRQVELLENRRHRPRDYTYFERKGYKIYGHPDMIITCIRCNETKNQKHFGIRWSDEYDIRTLLNLCNTCKNYNSKILQKIKKELNLPIPNECDICEKPDVNKIQIDHNHHTEKFRGFLCNPCNTSLGKFKDDPFMMIKVIKYLMKDDYYDKREVALKLRGLASELENA